MKQRTALIALSLLTAYSWTGQATDLTGKVLTNQAAYIPSQCYTKTRDDSGAVHNPCFSCHTEPRRPNFVNDVDLQTAYDFGSVPLTNHWRNLFKDRSAAVAAISDAEVESYIRTSNYFDGEGRIKPALDLATLPAGWDTNNNGIWDGFVPDTYFNFDQEGFDHAPDGTLTGWRAFAYYPFLGTFWPTNGSTDDVLIRLPSAFRQNLKGQESKLVYKVNLAIVESVVKEKNIAIAPVSEASLGGVDLDKDGKIGTARKIVYDWAPLEGRTMSYVGRAMKQQQQGKLHLAAGLYPEGTEFLHTVRYIDVNEAGDNLLAPRMKEVRYARKSYWMNYASLEYAALAEIKEKSDFPDRLRSVRGNVETGVSNDKGWIYAAMIEDAKGDLRPQTYEELVFCVGCHGGIGANRDGIFSFHRKFDYPKAHQKGWYHWTQKGIKGVPDRTRSDGKKEYVHYLRANGAGDEFRGNDEIRSRFFTAKGALKQAPVDTLRTDISTLLFASKARASNLNKAYWEIVKEQSFIEGRDATIAPVTTVHDQVPDDEETGVTTPVLGY